jgi:hypothetical protein
MNKERRYGISMRARTVAGTVCLAVAGAIIVVAPENWLRMGRFGGKGFIANGYLVFILILIGLVLLGSAVGEWVVKVRRKGPTRQPTL